MDVAINSLAAKYGADQFDVAVKKMQRGAASLDRDLGKTETGVSSLGGAFGQLGSRITGVAAVYGLSRFVKSSIKEMANFEQELANVSTMLDDQAMKYLPKYKEELSKLAVKYGVSTTILSKGLRDILSANVDASKALNVLNTASIAAIAGLSQTGEVVDVLTTVINAYGMSADDAMKISDTLFATIARGKTTFGELASSLGQITSLAAMSGLSFEELCAALATMTRSGVSTGAAVGSLRGILNAFLDPTKESTEAAKSFGLQLNTNTLRTIGLTGAIKLLQGATAEEMSAVFGNVRALSGLSALIQQTDGFMYDLTQTTDSAGKTMKAYGEVSDTTSKKLDQLNESWKALKRTAGEEFQPALTPVLKGLIDLIPKLANYPRNLGVAALFAASEITKLRASLLDAIPGMKDNAEVARQASNQFEGWKNNILGADIGLKNLSTTIADVNKKQEDVDRKIFPALKGNEEALIKMMKKKGIITAQNTVISDKEIETSKEAREEANQLMRELQFEQKILFLTDDERERAIKLAELEAVAKKDLTGESAKLVEEYKDELQKLADMKEMKKLVTTVTDSVSNLVETPLAAILDSTKNFGDLIEDELRNLGKSILTMLYKEMITAPIKKAATTFLAETLPTLFLSEKGLVMNRSGRLERFGFGGVVNRPTLFPMANGMGLMGEKEPEAVMPLARDKSGKLGVRMEGSQNESSLKIINVLDKSMFEDYLSSGAGERVVVNIMRRNQDQVSRTS